MDGLRILLGNEPLAYREVLQAAVSLLRPTVQVSVVEPSELDGAVRRWRPHLVICSRCEGAPGGPLGWVALYPEGRTAATVRVDDEEMTLPDMELDGLVSLIDRIALLVRFACGARPGPASSSAGD